MASSDFSIYADLQITPESINRSIRQVESSLSSKKLNLDLNTKQFSGSLGTIRGDVSQFSKSLEAANARVIAFGASTVIIYKIQEAFESLVGEAINVEKQLQDINVIFNLSSNGLKKFSNDLFETAKNTGQSFNTVATAAKEFSRQGLGAQETTKRTRDAMILLRQSGLDSEKAVSKLTAIMNVYGGQLEDTTQIINKLSNVDSNFAVSMEDLVEAFSRSASSAKEAGVSFDEFTALVTVAQQATARGGAVIGNAFKTIFARLQSSDTLDILKKWGVAYQDVNGKMLDGIDLLKSYAEGYKKLKAVGNEMGASELSQKVGGKLQLNILLATTERMIGAQNEYTRAQKISEEATNEAIKRNEQLNNVTQVAFNQTKENARQLSKIIGDISFLPDVHGGLSFLNKSILEPMINSLNGEDAGSKIGKSIISGIGKTFLGPLATLAVGILGKLLVKSAVFAAGALKDLIGMSDAASKQAAIQAKIGEILSKNASLYSVINSSAVSQVEKERLITQELRTQVNEKMKLEALTGNLAASAMRSGISANLTKNVLTSKTKTFADGYLPKDAEKKQILKGVGGSNISDQPVRINKFNFGGGKVSDVVANTGEWIVRNYNNSGADAIFNRDMVAAHGLPEGAIKIKGDMASGSENDLGAYKFIKSMPKELLSSLKLLKKENPDLYKYVLNNLDTRNPQNLKDYWGFGYKGINITDRNTKSTVMALIDRGMSGYATPINKMFKNFGIQKQFAFGYLPNDAFSVKNRNFAKGMTPEGAGFDPKLEQILDSLHIKRVEKDKIRKEMYRAMEAIETGKLGASIAFGGESTPGFEGTYALNGQRYSSVSRSLGESVGKKRLEEFRGVLMGNPTITGSELFQTGEQPLRIRNELVGKRPKNYAVRSASGEILPMTSESKASPRTLAEKRMRKSVENLTDADIEKITGVKPADRISGINQLRREMGSSPYSGRGSETFDTNQIARLKQISETPTKEAKFVKESQTYLMQGKSFSQALSLASKGLKDLSGGEAEAKRILESNVGSLSNFSKQIEQTSSDVKTKLRLQDVGAKAASGKTLDRGERYLLRKYASEKILNEDFGGMSLSAVNKDSYLRSTYLQKMKGLTTQLMPNQYQVQEPRLQKPSINLGGIMSGSYFSERRAYYNAEDLRARKQIEQYGNNVTPYKNLFNQGGIIVDESGKPLEKGNSKEEIRGRRRVTGGREGLKTLSTFAVPMAMSMGAGFTEQYGAPKPLTNAMQVGSMGAMAGGMFGLPGMAIGGGIGAVAGALMGMETAADRAAKSIKEVTDRLNENARPFDELSALEAQRKDAMESGNLIKADSIRKEQGKIIAGLPQDTQNLFEKKLNANIDMGDIIEELGGAAKDAIRSNAQSTIFSSYVGERSTEFSNLLKPEKNEDLVKNFVAIENQKLEGKPQEEINNEANKTQALINLIEQIKSRNEKYGEKSRIATGASKYAPIGTIGSIFGAPGMAAGMIASSIYGGVKEKNRNISSERTELVRKTLAKAMGLSEDAAQALLNDKSPEDLLKLAKARLVSLDKINKAGKIISRAANDNEERSLVTAKEIDKYLATQRINLNVEQYKSQFSQLKRQQNIQIAAPFVSEGTISSMETLSGRKTLEESQSQARKQLTLNQFKDANSIVSALGIQQPTERIMEIIKKESSAGLESGKMPTEIAESIKNSIGGLTQNTYKKIKALVENNQGEQNIDEITKLLPQADKKTLSKIFTENKGMSSEVIMGNISKLYPQKINEETYKDWVKTLEEEITNLKKKQEWETKSYIAEREYADATKELSAMKYKLANAFSVILSKTETEAQKSQIIRSSNLEMTNTRYAAISPYLVENKRIKFEQDYRREQLKQNEQSSQTELLGKYRGEFSNLSMAGVQLLPENVDKNKYGEVQNRFKNSVTTSSNNKELISASEDLLENLNKMGLGESAQAQEANKLLQIYRDQSDLLDTQNAQQEKILENTIKTEEEQKKRSESVRAGMQEAFAEMEKESRDYAGLGKTIVTSIGGGINSMFTQLTHGAKPIDAILSSALSISDAIGEKSRGMLISSVMSKIGLDDSYNAPKIDTNVMGGGLNSASVMMFNSSLDSATRAVFMFSTALGSAASSASSKSIIRDVSSQSFSTAATAAKNGGLILNGRVKRFATGGRVFGQKGTDRVPALLTDGEMVLNKNAARMIGYSDLDKINHYADGGGVGFAGSNDDLKFKYTGKLGHGDWKSKVSNMPGNMSMKFWRGNSPTAKEYWSDESEDFAKHKKKIAERAERHQELKSLAISTATNIALSAAQHYGQPYLEKKWDNWQDSRTLNRWGKDYGLNTDAFKSNTVSYSEWGQKYNNSLSKEWSGLSSSSQNKYGSYWNFKQSVYYSTPRRQNIGGLVNGYANGGKVVPFLGNGGEINWGESGIDRVPTMLSKGEVVIKKSVVDRVGSDRLLKLNNSYASGGLVDSTNKNTKNSSNKSSSEPTSTTSGKSSNSNINVNINIAGGSTTSTQTNSNSSESNNTGDNSLINSPDLAAKIKATCVEYISMQQRVGGTLKS